jgi:hypothetical protein
MKGIAVAAAGLLIASFVCPGTTRAQQSEPDKKPKLTLSGVEAQVVTLQTTVSSLQTTVSSLQTTVSSLQSTVSSLQSSVQNFAVVASDGTLVRGSSSVSGALQNPVPGTIGQYFVIFKKDVSGCAYVATIGDTDSANAVPGEIWVATLNSTPPSVFVQTTDSTGAASDRPFHLSVICP